MSKWREDGSTLRRSSRGLVPQKHFILKGNRMQTYIILNEDKPYTSQQTLNQGILGKWMAPMKDGIGLLRKKNHVLETFRSTTWT